MRDNTEDPSSTQILEGMEKMRYIFCVFYTFLQHLVRARMIGTFQGDSDRETMVNNLYMDDRCEKVDLTANTRKMRPHDPH